MKHALLLLPFVFLVACDPAPVPNAPPPQSGADACGASGYQGLVGSPLAAVTLPNTLNARIIPPGTAVTMDYREDRMNIETDAAGRITRVYCG